MKNIRLPVPLAHQSDYCACVAASLSAIYYYWKGLNKNFYFERDFSKILGRKIENGTTTIKILNAIKKLKLRHKYEEAISLDDLKKYVEMGTTVMAFVQTPSRKPPKDWNKIWNRSHAVVVVGMNSKRIFLMDPLYKESYIWMPIKEFDARWHDKCYSTYNDKRNYHSAVIIWGDYPAITTAPPKYVRAV